MRFGLGWTRCCLLTAVLVAVSGCASGAQDTAHDSIATASPTGPGRTATPSITLPSPTATSPASPSPSASPTATSGGTDVAPPVVRANLGTRGEAVLLVTHGDATAGKVSAEIVAVGSSGTSRVVAKLPEIGRTTAGDRWGIRQDAEASLSDRGFLLVPVSRRADKDPAQETGEQAWWLYDLLAPTAAPKIVPMSEGAAADWGPNGRLVIVEESGAVLYDAATGSSTSLTIAAGVVLLPTWTADGRGFYARRTDDPGWEGLATGTLGTNGLFGEGPVVAPYMGLPQQGRNGEMVQTEDLADEAAIQVAPGTTDADPVTWYTSSWPSAVDAMRAVTWDSRLSGLWVVEPGDDASQLVHLSGPHQATIVKTAQPLADSSFVGVSGDAKTIALQENGTAEGAIVVVDTLSGAVGRYAIPNAGPNDAAFFLGWGTGGQ